MLHAVFHNVADSLACPCGISVKIPFGTNDKLLPAQLNGYEQGRAGLFISISRLTVSLLNCTVPASSFDIFSRVVISQSMRPSSS